MKGFSIGCAGFIVGLIAGMAFFLAVFLFVMPRSAQALTPPPTVAGQPDVSVTVSAALVNAQLQQSLRQYNVVRQATVTFASPNIVRGAFNVQTSVAGVALSTNATVSMHATVQNGRVVLAVDSVDTGGLNLDQSVTAPAVEQVRALMENQINQMLQSSLQGTHLTLIGLVTTPSTITFQFKYGES